MLDPVVKVLDVDDAASRHFAPLVVALRKKAVFIPTNDLWIPILVMREAATVLTYDVHFSAIEEVASLILTRD